MSFEFLFIEKFLESMYSAEVSVEDMFLMLSHDISPVGGSLSSFEEEGEGGVSWDDGRLELCSDPCV